MKKLVILLLLLFITFASFSQIEETTTTKKECTLSPHNSFALATNNL
jgi:hypothetical protein